VASAVVAALVTLFLTLVRSVIAGTAERVLPGPWRKPDPYDPITRPVEDR
jgi:hypothetical protein